MQLDATKIHDSRAGAQLSFVETVLACGCFCSHVSSRLQSHSVLEPS